MMIQFQVTGKAKPAGSKRGFVRNNKVMIVDTSGKEGKIWRHVVQDRAREAMSSYTELIKGDIKNPIIIGPVSLYIKFTISRPKHHYGSGKNASVILPRYKNIKPTGKPDVTKLVRAVEDALTGVVWKDDSQVFKQFAVKEYGDTDETLVKIFPHIPSDQDDNQDNLPPL